MSGAAGALPAPLSPPECDLRTLGYVPLFGVALFGSEFYARANDAEFRAGIKLLWVAWTQVPAGSLPDDDVALCLYADMGRDVAGWQTVRARALRGFVLCSDGRLYHPFLCEQALIAWDKRIKAKDRKAAWRDAKAEKAVGRNGPVPGTERGQNGPVPSDGTGRDVFVLTNKDVPSRTGKEPTKGTPGHEVPSSRLPATTNTQQPKTQQPLSSGSVPRSEPTDGKWRTSKEGIKAKAAELGIPPYDPRAAQLRRAPSWPKYERAVLKAHAEACQLKLVGRP